MKSIITYKGTDNDMKCRGFQYEIGKEFETEKAKACEIGFHACKYPLDVLGYYPPAGSRFFECEQSGEISEHGEDSKVASTKIKFNAEIGIPGLVKAAVEYVVKNAKPSKKHHTTGNRSANSATGNRSANSATGNRSANSATGNYSANSATGNYSANSATGNYSANSATGYYSANSATGYYSANSATGDYSANSATGYRSANSATGYGSANISTGLECSNDAAGERNVSVSWGKSGKCKGAVGSFLVLSEWGDWDGDKHPFIGAVMVEVDGNKIKADTWYTMKDGKVVEVE